MKETNKSRQAYERPWTEKVTVEVEFAFATSTTNYDNAGSAGEGEYKDNPFEEFGAANNASSGTTTSSFDEWSNY